MNLGLLPLLMPAMVAGPVGPPPPPAPVLYVRFVGPEGTLTMFHPGTPLERGFKNPTTVAMRPGYIYRVGIILPDAPERPLFPSIEIRGSLNAPPGYDFTKYPLPITMTTEEIERVRSGAMLTKVIYLENPEKAVAIQTSNDEPLQFSALTEGEAFKEANLRGRIVAVMHIGERKYAPDELARFMIPGTILLPGEEALAPAAIPPMIPCTSVPLYDPILGPRWSEDECLHDGGDILQPLGIDNERRLFGLNPSDTSMEYSIGKRRKVTTSNKVCICVPRFVAFVVDTVPNGFQGARNPGVTKLGVGGSALIAKRLPTYTRQADIVALLRVQNALRLTISEFGLAQTLYMNKPEAIATLNGTHVIGEYVGLDELTASPDCGLMLMKWVEPRGPHQIGDTVTFFLRYRNPLNEPLTDVVVSDSLTARLEYLPGTAKSERASNFTIAPNEAGSTILRWQIPGQLLPGQSGVVSFQAKIR